MASPGRSAARVMLAIADNYDRRVELDAAKAGAEPRAVGLTIDALAERFDVSLIALVAIADHLEHAGLIVSLGGDQGYVPGRPLEQIDLGEVLGLFDGDVRKIRADTLTELFEEFDEQQRLRVAALSFRDLIQLESRRRAGHDGRRTLVRRPNANPSLPTELDL